MTEVTIAGTTLIALLFAYLVIYPRYAGNNIMKLAKFDFVIGILLLAILAPNNWNKPNDYTFIFLDTNWWIFTILTYALIEIPFYLIYLKSRGLVAEMRKFFESGGKES